MRKITILLVTHYYPSHRGGVEIVAGELVKALLKGDEIEIIWVASDTDTPPTEIKGLSCLPMKTSNQIEEKISLPYPLWSLKSWLSLWGIVKKVDIIHIHDYLYLGNLISFCLAKLHKKPIIVTQHIGYIPYDNPFFRWLLSFLNQTLGVVVLKNAEQVVFISEVVLDYFSSKTKFLQPPILIPNGVDTKTFHPTTLKSRQKIREELQLSGEKLVFLFVGRFVEKKGLPLLKELAIKFPNIDWLFAGWGIINPREWQLDNVRVFSDRSLNSLTPLYQTADLLILPSKGEGFPLVVQESMACGTPVLINSETAAAYTPAQSLILAEAVDKENPLLTWSEKIKQIVDDPNILHSKREQVATFAQQHWDWQNCAYRYHQILNQLL